MGKNILIVVDAQYDFCNPNGALYVNDAEKIENEILKIIKDFDYVMFTQDYHPLNHCSFKENGGIWPIHCVCETIGMGISVELFKAAKDYTIVSKGNDPMVEEYGAFSDEYDLYEQISYSFERSWEKPAKEFINDVDSIVICGVAGDWCVLETLKNIVNHIGMEKVSVYLDGVASIDNGEKLNNYMNENNIKSY